VSRVLVTGASGFIGRRVLGPLVEAGHEVHAVSRRGAGGAEAVTWHAVDLQSSVSVVAAVRPAVLVHLAWYAEHGTYWTSTENVRWVEASLALLRAFAEAGGSRAVVAGTCAEYAWTTKDVTLCESVTPLAPATLYGAAKHGLHQVAAAYAAQAGFGLAWGRVFFLYGPDEAPGRLFGSVARALLAGERAATTEGTQERDFLHVDDVGAAFAALAGSATTGAVNIGSGEGVAVRALVEEIADAVGRRDLLDVGATPQREGEPARLVADVRRLRDEVGFTPAFGLRDGISAAVSRIRSEAPARQPPPSR
jgi:nucleoside-diphosphate-sugar epimerase